MSKQINEQIYEHKLLSVISSRMSIMSIMYE